MEEMLSKSSGLISISSSCLTLLEASHSCHGNALGCPWPGEGGGRAGGGRPLWMDAWMDALSDAQEHVAQTLGRIER